MSQSDSMASPLASRERKVSSDLQSFQQTKGFENAERTARMSRAGSARGETPQADDFCHISAKVHTTTSINDEKLVWNFNCEAEKILYHTTAD